jgi:AbrB family transcriptional regulator (stage V sporulation protein T)
LKSTGVIRRIDELGRIVLPKEIRRNLGIREGENLEIFVSEDAIVLKKYSKLADSNEIVKSIGSLVSAVYPVKIIITDRDSVVYSSVTSVLNGFSLNDCFIKMIQNRESLLKDELQVFKIGDIELKGYFLIMPIISSIDSLGLIILYDEANIPNYYVNLVKFISSIILSKIDIA